MPASVVVALRILRAGWVAAAHGLSCSASCRNFLDQECNLCSLHWQQDSTTKPPERALLIVDWEERLWKYTVTS